MIPNRPKWMDKPEAKADMKRWAAANPPGDDPADVEAVQGYLKKARAAAEAEKRGASPPELMKLSNAVASEWFVLTGPQRKIALATAKQKGWA
jgi:hypothetical protein